MSGAASRSGDPDLIAKTARLVEFLRDLSSLRRERVREITEYESHLWLNDLPDEVSIKREAGPGETLLTVEPPPPVPFPEPPDVLDGWLGPTSPRDSGGPEPVLQESAPGEEIPPEVPAAFDRWLPRWREWAERERVVARQRRWHQTLWEHAGALSQQDDEYELVLATGLLTWRAPDGTKVRNHLLTTPVELVKVGRGIEVVLGGRTSVQDRSFLDDLKSFDAHRTSDIRERVREGEAGFGLDPGLEELLTDWCDRAFEHGATYRDDWEPSPKGSVETQVRPAPAFVFRKRDRASLVSYYEQMLAVMSGPNAEAPLGLAQLITALEPPERMAFLTGQGAASGEVLGTDPLFPLPANPEQRQIMERLRTDNGVVVQGPPGTGKTHTIANLVASLLAQGQRVLVTSQKAQALRVLRDKLPPDIAHLCVSATDQGRGGSAELEGSVKELSSRFASFDANLQAKEVAKLEGRLADSRRRMALLTEQIRMLREAETYDHGRVAPGYSGTLAKIVQALKRHRDSCSWMPVPLPKDADDTPPVPVFQADELLGLLAEETPGRRARLDQRLPDPSSLPSAEQVRALVAAEAAATTQARQSQNGLSDLLSGCDDQLFAHLERQKETVSDVLHELGLPAEPQNWPEDWTSRALQDVFAGRDDQLWAQIAAYESRAVFVAEAARRIGFRQIVLPAFTPAGPGGMTGQLQAAQQLRDHLRGGNKLKKGILRPAVQKQAEPLLQGALVDGIAPTTPELLDLVIDELSGRLTCQELARGWALVQAVFEEAPLSAMAARFTEAYARLRKIGRARASIRETAARLSSAGIRIQLRSPEDWNEYVSSLQAVRLRLNAERATARITELSETLELEISKGQAPPELEAARTAVSARDADAYARCLTGLADALRELREQRRCAELLGPVRAAHPALARLMAESPADPGWRQRLGAWEAAWAWGKATTFFDEQRRPGRERKLESDLEAATQRQLTLVSELAAANAWLACLSKMTARHATALRTYRDHMTKLGKGTGRYAPKYRALARQAMAESIGAVPAWIMPLQQVVETIPAARDSFDVVIVDEASQAGMEALFLLWLAPRVIVVGDDKQCAPSAISHGELQPIFDKLASYLPDVPAYLRDVFTPKSSLFDLLSTRFGSVIRLKEHFRCMPEIIGYSSRQFYADEPLVPLRQFGADRLPPLRVVKVDGAFTEGTSTRLRNETEARAIVEQIKACLDDPVYVGKSFGVVVLQGHGQVDLIQGMLLDEIELEELDRRKIRVGTPPDFQGDERDVVFLSMVIAEQRTSFTSTNHQRSFNVAASRAKDQMWLFHSVTPDLLRSTDLRHSLLAYMLNPPSSLVGEVLGDVSPDEAHPAFDSLFEQRVFLRIAERGYHVVPQFEVGGRRIDLVVSGARGRLAVECDGDFWHGTPEQVAADNERERELKRAGWRFWRIRESEFYFNPDAALKSLWEALEQLGIRPGEGAETEENSVAPVWRAVPLSDAEEDGLEETAAPAPVPPPRRPAESAAQPAPPEPARPAVSSAPRRAAEPPITPGESIDTYRDKDLLALIHWIVADEVERDAEQLMDEAVHRLALPLSEFKATSQARTRVRHAIERFTRVHADRIPVRDTSPPPVPHLPQEAEAPELPTGLPIDRYSESQLTALIRWIESDGRDRTVSELIDRIVEELAIVQTRQATQVLEKAIRLSRAETRRQVTDREPTKFSPGTEEVRTWARRQRYELSGRSIPAHVIAQYNLAHPERPY